MKSEYQYPLNLEWSTNEMVVVMAMWDKLEQAYEKGIKVTELLATYQAFKTVVRSIGEERKLGKEFEVLSGYSLYHTIKEAQTTQKSIVKMKG